MRTVKKGATSQSIYFDVLDSTSTTGGRKTGLAYNTSSLVAYYVRNGDVATAITLATLAAANTAWSSGGFKEVDATNMPGIYRLDVPDAAFATGADSVAIVIKGATGMVQASCDVQLVDNLASDIYARLGAPAGASTAADVAAIKAVLPAALVSGRIDASVGAMAANVMTAAAAASDLTTELQAGLAMASAVATLQTSVDDLPTNAELTTALAGADDAVLAQVALVKAKTDNLPDDPADESLIIAATDSLAGLISGLNNISQADVRNAVGLASADLDTQLATLSTSAEISDLQTHGDGAWGTATGFSTLGGSDVSAAVWDVAMADHLGAGTTGDAIFQAGVHAPSADTKADTILANLAVTDGKVDAIDTNVDAILVDTGTDIPASIAALNDISAAEVNAEVDQAISDAALATAASLATTDGKVDAVQDKTDQLAFTGDGVSADMRSINGATLIGDGSVGDKFGPA